jgi:RNA polymerase sigma-70 factor (ECF subfamily)
MEGLRLMESQEEFLTLFLQHQADIRAFVGALVRDRAARDDVQQEVALVLWKEFAKFDRSKSFGAWARGIAANKIRQRWEKAAQGPLPLTAELMSSILDGFERSQQASTTRGDALEHCLGLLPDKSRELVRLRYEQSLKLEEIATRVQSSADAVHKALSRLRERLLDCVERRVAALER